MVEQEICSKKLRGHAHNRNLLITRVPEAGFFGFLLNMRVESRPLNELGLRFNRFEWVRKRCESATTVWVTMGGREWRVYVLRLGRDYIRER